MRPRARRVYPPAARGPRARAGRRSRGWRGPGPATSAWSRVGSTRFATGRLARIGALAALGTFFQWWAVIGWTEGRGVYAGLVFGGVLARVGRDVWRRLAEHASTPTATGRVIPLPPARSAERREAA